MKPIKMMRAFGYCLLFTVAIAQSPGRADHHEPGKQLSLPNCPVMDEPIDLSVFTKTDDGPVFFCCKGCIEKYTGNPQKYAARVEAQRAALKDLPKIQVDCPVSGNPVDSKVSIDHDGQKVYFCCKGCVPKYQADPGKYKAALANGYTYQTKCPVMGESINPQVFGVLPTGQKIYYCCKRCDKALRTEPAKYAPKLAAQGIRIDPSKITGAAVPGLGQ